jgi:hypothetical protein
MLIKNTETLIDASKEVSLEINVEKTKYMLLSHLCNTDQSHDIKIVNRLFENMAQLRFLRMAVINKNLIQEEIKKKIEFW